MRCHFFVAAPHRRVECRIGAAVKEEDTQGERFRHRGDMTATGHCGPCTTRPATPHHTTPLTPRLELDDRHCPPAREKKKGGDCPPASHTVLLRTTTRRVCVNRSQSGPFLRLPVDTPTTLTSHPTAHTSPSPYPSSSPQTQQNPPSSASPPPPPRHPTSRPRPPTQHQARTPP